MEWTKEEMKEYKKERIIEKKISVMEIKELFTLYQKGRIDFDFKLLKEIKFQREFVWKLKNFEELFISIKHGLDIGSISVIQEKNNNLMMIADGKQRLYSLFKFIEGDFKISRNFKDAKFMNRFWSDLPEQVQNDILSYKIPVVTTLINNEEEKKIASKSFPQINTCVRINGFERVRALLGFKNEQLEKLAQNKIFSLTNINNSRYNHQKFCFICIMLNMYSNNKNIKTNIGSKDMQNFAESLQYMPQFEPYIIKNVEYKFDYLVRVFNNDIYKNCKKYINGNHFINLYLLSDRVMDKVEPNIFFKWAHTFFYENKEDNEYWNDVKIKSTTNGNSIKKKVDFLKKDLTAFIKKNKLN